MKFLSYFIIALIVIFISCKKDIKFKINNSDFKNFIQATITRDPAGRTFFEINVLRFGKAGSQKAPSIQNIGGVLTNNSKNYTLHFLKGSTPFVPGIITGGDMDFYSARIDSSFNINAEYKLQLIIDNDTINTTAFLTDTIKKIATKILYINAANIQTYHLITEPNMSSFSYATQETVENPNVYFEGQVYDGLSLIDFNLPSKLYWGCLFPTTSQVKNPIFYKMTAMAGTMFSNYKKILYNYDEPLSIPFSFEGNINTPKSYGYFIGFCATKGESFTIEDRSDTAFKFYFKDKNGIKKDLKNDYEFIKMIVGASTAKSYFSHSDSFAYLSKNTLCDLISLKDDNICDSNGELSRAEDMKISIVLSNRNTNKSIATIPITINSESLNKTAFITIPE